MDLVDLTLRIEDEFGLSISDEDATRIETVGQTYDYLCEKLASRPGERCSSMLVFNRLRKAMVTTLGVPREQVLPSTRVAQLLTVPTERWKQLSAAAGLTLPPVGSMAVMHIIGTTVILFVAALIVLPVVTMDPLVTVVCCILGLAGLLAALLYQPGGGPIFVYPVSPKEPFGSYVRKAVVQNRLPAVTSHWTEERIWLTLTEIISETLGVPAKDLRRQTHYVRDLNAD